MKKQTTQTARVFFEYGIESIMDDSQSNFVNTQFEFFGWGSIFPSMETTWVCALKDEGWAEALEGALNPNGEAIPYEDIESVLEQKSQGFNKEMDLSDAVWFHNGTLYGDGTMFTSEAYVIRLEENQWKLNTVASEIKGFEKMGIKPFRDDFELMLESESIKYKRGQAVDNIKVPFFRNDYALLTLKEITDLLNEASLNKTEFNMKLAGMHLEFENALPHIYKAIKDK